MYNFPQTIFSAIRQEIDDFLYTQIELVNGFGFNQYDTIKKIHLYYNSHFENGDYEDINGVIRKKFFYNINKWRCDVSTKMLDLDVKDLMLASESNEYDIMVRILEKELKQWMKRGQMSVLMNDISRYLPIYGSVLIKKVMGSAKIVDLRHLFIDQSANSYKDARYVTLKHLMTPSQLRKKKNVWNDVDLVIDKYCSFGTVGYEDEYQVKEPQVTPYAEIYERFGEVPLSFITGKQKDDNEYVDARFICAGVKDYDIDENTKSVTDNGIILFKEIIKERPFKEIHYTKTEGRWLGIGVVEDTFEAQRRKNELENQKGKAMELSSLIVFQTQGESLGRNLISDFENGDVVKVNREIQRIPTEERDLGSYNQSSGEVEKLADRQTFSYDVLRGEASPATSTAFAVQTQLQQATSVFDYKRENISIALSEFIQDFVFPELKKEIKKSHILQYTGDVSDIDFVRDALIESFIRPRMLEYIANTGRIPTQMEIDMMKEGLKTQMAKRDGNKIWIKIVDNFFEDIDGKVTVVISGENKNVAGELSSIDQLLAGIVRNPQALQDPVVSKLVLDRARIGGMDTTSIEALIASQKGAQPIQQMQNAQPIAGTAK